MTTWLIDFETKSRLNLQAAAKKPGTNAFRYAAHPSTQVFCLGYRDVDGPDIRHVWFPGEPFPFAPRDTYVAFNAGFELVIWNLCCVRLYGWPQLAPEGITCMQAEGAYMGLPRSLDNVSKALCLGSQAKNKAGRRALLKMTRPAKATINDYAEYEDGEFLDDPKINQAVVEYCLQDVGAEQRMYECTQALPPLERKLWLLNHKLNSRGLPIDRALCENAHTLYLNELGRLQTIIADLTGGEVQSPTQTVELKNWLNRKGVPVTSVAVDELKHLTRDRLQSYPNCHDIRRVELVLEHRNLARDAAAGKFRATLAHAGPDDRCRGQFIYYQAGTGRWQTKGVNFGNLKRLRDDQIPGLLTLADRIAAASPDELDGIAFELAKPGVIPSIAKLARMVIKAPPGKMLAVRDYSSIEMNMLHWLANDEKTLKYIADFYAGKGDEPYKIAASKMYHVPIEQVNGTQRSAGKVYYLGCGYCASANSLAAFAEGYGIKMTYEEAKEMVSTYREDNHLVVNLWYDYLRAAKRAVETPGRRVEVKGIEFYMDGPTLKVLLRSGRELCYYRPKVVAGMYGPEIECTALSDGKGAKNGRRWLRISTLVENIDQAISRDLLADALLKCDQANLDVVLHVYDEIVIESDEAKVDADSNTLRDIMLDPPAWAKGLPLQVKGGCSPRYTK